MILFSFILLILFQINALANTVKNLKTENIIGGTRVPPHILRYQVSVHVDDRFKCGGGIMNSQFALTVTHCVIDDETGTFFEGRFSIGIDTDASCNLTTRFEVIMAYFLKTYDPKIVKINKTRGAVDDIAMLQINGSFLADSKLNLTPLQIPDEQFSYFKKVLIVAGYGINSIEIVQKKTKSKEIRSLDGKLRYVEVIATSQSDCNYIFDIRLGPSIICGKIIQDMPYPKGTCDGDSGSPLVYNNQIVIAVLSSGPSDCNELNRASIYTSIFYYSSFINNVMNGTRTIEMRVAAMTNTNNSRFQFVEI